MTAEQKAQAIQAQNAAANEPAEEASQLQGISKMKSGTYVVHVHVQKAKRLQLDDDDTSDPYIKICILDQEKQTNTKEDVTRDQQVTYDEHLFFEFRHLETEEVEQATIRIVAENKGFFKGDLIGQFEMSLNKIYNMKSNCLFNQLIALNNPQGDDFTKITGYVAVSIQVQGPGDEAVELKLATDKQLEVTKPLIPTQIKKQYKQVYLRFYMAENLPAMDTNLISADSIDAYLKVSYNGTALKTKYVTMENSKVVWNVEMLIPVELPLREENIKVQLWDWDPLVDEFVCSLDLPVKSMLKYTQTDASDSNNTKMKWLNFYGPPRGCSGKHTDKMRRDPTYASHWAGRVLCEYFCIDNKYPTFKVRKIKDRQAIKRVETLFFPRKYFIIGEAGEGICLPDKKSYSLKVSLGKFDFQVEPQQSKKEISYVRWSRRFQGEIETNYRDLKYFPTIYVYLMDGDNPVCYYRESILNFTKYVHKTPPAEQAAFQWYQFEPDLAYGTVTNPMLAGMFSMRLYIHDITNDGPFDPSNHPTWSKRPPRQLNPFRMRAAIYQCESLPPADSEGTSDPYIEVYSNAISDHQKGKIVTDVCEDTNNPIFYEVKEFFMQFKENDLNSAMPIVLNVWDSDAGVFGDSDDLIGRAIISLEELKEKNAISFDDTIPKPHWFPVKKHLQQKHDSYMGPAILASFQMVSLETNYAVPAEDIELDDHTLQIQPGVPYPMPNLQIVEFKCEVIVLGLRDLVSTGVLPINKAFVQFNLKSLLPAAKAKAVQNIQTQPNDRGPNPNMRTILQFEVQMPDHPEFCPRMTCDAYDLVFAGLSQPHVGTFTLDMGGSYRQELNKNRETLDDLVKVQRAMQKLFTEVDGQIAVGEEVDVFEMAKKLDLKNAIRARSALLKDSDMAKGRQVLGQLKSMGLKLPQPTAKKAVKGSKAGAASQEGSMVDFEAIDVQVDERGAPIPREPVVDQIELAQIQAKEAKEADVAKLKKLFGSELRKKVEIAFKTQQEEAKNQLDKERAEAQRMFQRDRKDAQNNVVMPQYKFDTRLGCKVEYNVPPDSLFMQVGFDSEPEAGKKHYRRFYPDELEKITDKDGDLLVESPFIRRQIYRAKAAKKENFLASLFQMDDGGSDMQSVEAGYFKGILRVYREDEERKNQHDIKESFKAILNNLDQLHALVAEQELKKGRKLSKCHVTDLLKFMSNNENKAVNAAETEQALDHLRDMMYEIGLPRVGIHKLACDIIFENQLMSKLNQVVQCKVRVYVMSGFNMAKRDLFSESDPYLVMKCGKKVYNDVDNYQLDTNKPEFYKSFDFIVEFPGAPDLEIECWDYDGFFGDELIGKSTLDLDDRYYSLSWQSLSNKPIEYRDLFHSSSTVTQGVLKMWVEINEKDDKKAQEEAMDIQPEPVREFEMRVVVWKTKEIPNFDEEGCSDIQVKTYIDSDNPVFTDTHWRCQNGNGSFNYRCLLPFDSNQEEVHLRVEAWDRDIIKSNDLIGGATLDLTDMVNDVKITNKKQVLHKKYFAEYLSHQMRKNGNGVVEQITFEDKDRFWVPVLKEDPDSGEFISNGEILITVHCVPKEEAEKFPQAMGREEPNTDPHCPPPEGRIKLSIDDPIGWLTQLIPAKAWRQIAMYLCIAACIALCVMMAPMIISNLIAKAMTG